MLPRNPKNQLGTHEVLNMPHHLGDQDLWSQDQALQFWTNAFHGGWANDRLKTIGKIVGSQDVFDKAEKANKYGPELKVFDKYGMRIDQVEFHPAYHELLNLAVSNEVHNFAWRNKRKGSHVVNSALIYMFCQPEGGIMCPMAMAYSVAPALKGTPEVEKKWMPGILSTTYDMRDIPIDEKKGNLIGMFMTEKQGGSDVRANTTHAKPLGKNHGISQEYLITGHKFFCSAPMCDAFLVLAKTEGYGASCFLVPRWKPDGTRNSLNIQRMKDKLGNRSNASTEMEFRDTFGIMVGDEGSGIKTIMDMVTGNPIYCAMSSAGIMRQSLVQAIHHVSNRSAFQKRIIQQPLMQNVIADMAIETEAALALGMRVASAIDSSNNNDEENAFARVGTAIAKYWICKRAPSLVYEALECHGGMGYIEDSIMPRLYREVPLNSIWEGPGNIMVLDVLRALNKNPLTAEVVMKEIKIASHLDKRLDSFSKKLEACLSDIGRREVNMRTITQMMAIGLQASLLIQNSTNEVADAFCASRLESQFNDAFGSLHHSTNFEAIIERAYSPQ